MDEVLEFINVLIRSEKGNRVTIDSTLVDADLDSFGTATMFLDLDDKYQYFRDVPEDVDVFTTIDFSTITIKDIVNKCMVE